MILRTSGIGVSIAFLREAQWVQEAVSSILATRTKQK